jgi:hypothetical protein
MKQTLKIIISLTKPKGIAYKLRPKKMPLPVFHMEKEGEVGKGLNITIKEGIVITNLKGWVNIYNKRSSMAMSPPSICA